LFLQAWTPHDAEQHWGADPAGSNAVVAALRAVLPGRRVEAAELDFADPRAPEDCVAAATSAVGPWTCSSPTTHARASSGSRR
jgi:3-oxoacyl-[acyl-carrier protein] reductase